MVSPILNCPPNSKNSHMSKKNKPIRARLTLWEVVAELLKATLEPKRKAELEATLSRKHGSLSDEGTVHTAWTFGRRSSPYTGSRSR
jgi:hypothetical protein